MKILEYSFQPIDSRMYLLIEAYYAIVIDPCVNDEMLLTMKQHEIQNVKIILTHEHYDHISGVNWLQEHYRCTVLCSAACAEGICDDRKNQSRYYDALMLGKLKGEFHDKTAPYICNATESFENEMFFLWQNHRVDLKETPGHSKGSICIVVDNKFLFAGDTLIKGRKIITKLPGGSKEDYLKKTKPFLKSLALEVKVFPGHGESGYLREFQIF